jgi:ascorbate-specific PTS system EIIC-type component UlaA
MAGPRNNIMNFNNLIAAATNRLLGRMLRRALVVVVMGLCAMIALYHFTIAGNIALTGHFGDLNARLIIGAVYAAIALISLVILWTMRSKPADSATPVLSKPAETQLVLLVEAAMLGYAMARKGERAR